MINTGASLFLLAVLISQTVICKRVLAKGFSGDIEDGRIGDDHVSHFEVEGENTSLDENGLIHKTPVSFEGVIDNMYRKFRSRPPNGNVTFSEEYRERAELRKKRLSENEYKPLRIFFEASNMISLKQETKNSDYVEVINFLLGFVLPKVARLWRNSLSVIPTQGTISLTDETCFDEVQIPQQYINGGVENTDLVLLVKGLECDNSQSGALAFASPCKLDDIDDRPIVGIIYFCLNQIKVDKKGEILNQERKRAVEVAVHEIGHCLGFFSELMPYFRDPVSGYPRTRRPFKKDLVKCVDGTVRNVIRPAENTILEGESTTGNRFFQIVTPTVATVVRNQFDCRSLTGAILESKPSSNEDCFGSHWSERYFFTEIMSPKLGEGYNILSPLTLALLEDTGWYQPNYASVSVSPFGHGAGCDFVKEACITDEQIPESSKGFFCNSVTNLDAGISKNNPTCDPSHTKLALCDLVHHNFEINTPYFSDANTGPLYFPEADLCPIPAMIVQDCHDDSKKRTSDIVGVKYSKRSKCFNYQASHGFKVHWSAFCLESWCDGRSKKLKVSIQENIYTCEFDGQLHPIPGYPHVSFECPKLFTACPDMICPANCSGKGICDFSLAEPKCTCFDRNDNTLGCFGLYYSTVAPTALNLPPGKPVLPPPNQIQPPTKSPIKLLTGKTVSPTPKQTAPPSISPLTSIPTIAATPAPTVFRLKLLAMQAKANQSSGLPSLHCHKLAFTLSVSVLLFLIMQ